MSLSHRILSAERVGADVHLRALWLEHKHPEDADTFVIENATVVPEPGDELMFGCEGIRYDDGTVFGGRGEITIDGTPWPYYRIERGLFVEAWHTEAAPPFDPALA